MYFKKKDPLNCMDFCHLAWLIRDQPYLLEKTNCYSGKPTCSNNTLLKNLHPERFDVCPTILSSLSKTGLQRKWIYFNKYNN